MTRWHDAKPSWVEGARLVHSRLTTTLGKLLKNGVHPSQLPAEVQRSIRLFRRAHRRVVVEGVLKITVDEHEAMNDLAGWLIEITHNVRGTVVPKTVWTPGGARQDLLL